MSGGHVESADKKPGKGYFLLAHGKIVQNQFFPSREKALEVAKHLRYPFVIFEVQGTFEFFNHRGLR